ncbi:MAG: hypothetical protein JWN30_1946 [Bacilli bacterium]|nr:hypothetical protein [Bacilli bacterium]
METKTDLRLKGLEQAAEMACSWLTDIAQVQTEQLTVEEDKVGHGYTSWKGAIRGEYSAAERHWWFFCPVWHTGQAVKALVLAYQRFHNDKYLQAARIGAAFIYDKQIWDEMDPDFGLILAYEDYANQVNTSAVFEGLHGLMLLADLEQSEDSWHRIEKAAEFMMNRLFLPDKGVFLDLYDAKNRRIVSPSPFSTKNKIGGRPLLDDAIFLKLYQKTGRRDFLDVHLKVAHKLIEDQNPAGNWIDYTPCSATKGLFHPRHTYWWGFPFIDTFRELRDPIYLETAIASGEFCLKAMRRDGGWFRGLDTDFNTDSFGHATSGSACASILFLHLYEETGEQRWMSAAEKTLNYCMKMQLKETADPNLTGVILEKVLPPGGTDASPYKIRDLGTIFFITAAMKYLEVAKQLS